MVGHATAAEASGLSSGQSNESSVIAYYVDMMFRADRPSADANDAAVRGEAGRMLANTLRSGLTIETDETYLAQLVVMKTGLGPSDARNRVSDVISQARQTVDAARTRSARVLLWTFIALLSGAFCASFAATIGGRQRDHVVVVS
jgi:hypothetical protein